MPWPSATTEENTSKRRKNSWAVYPREINLPSLLIYAPKAIVNWKARHLDQRNKEMIKITKNNINRGRWNRLKTMNCKINKLLVKQMQILEENFVELDGSSGRHISWMYECEIVIPESPSYTNKTCDRRPVEILLSADGVEYVGVTRIIMAQWYNFIGEWLCKVGRTMTS